MRSLRPKQSGFTLVEVAIVLVIIGLLLAGALKGQSMIENAKVKALANEMLAVFTMLNVYRDTFQAVPGDDVNVLTHIPGSIKSTWSSVGNGTIDGDWTGDASFSSTSVESALFWQHVRMAGLATGIRTRGYALNTLGGRLGITSNSERPNSPAGVIANYYVCSSMIPGPLARSLDLMLDDGKGTTGLVFASVEAGVPVDDAKVLAAYTDSSKFTVCMAGN